MTFNLLDTEEWTPKIFCNYVKQKLEDKGVDYQIQYPLDLFIVGSMLKRLHREGKTQYYLKMKIDEIMEAMTFNSVNSLQFLTTLIPVSKKEPKKKSTGSVDAALSSGLKKRLKELRVGK